MDVSDAEMLPVGAGVGVGVSVGVGVGVGVGGQPGSPALRQSSGGRGVGVAVAGSGVGVAGSGVGVHGQAMLVKSWQSSSHLGSASAETSVRSADSQTPTAIAKAIAISP